MRPTSIDLLLGARAFFLGLAVLCLGVVVVVSTDEQSTSAAARLARVASLMAVAGAMGALLATEQARSRGELRAMAALGVSPSRASLGAVCGGTLVGLVGPILGMWQRVDISPLFPRPSVFGAFRVLAADLVLELSRGVVVNSSGVLERSAHPATVDGAPSIPRVAACGALLVLAVVAPWWAVSPASLRRRVGIGALGVLCCVFAFHLVAAGWIPGWMLPLAPFVFIL